MAPEMTPRMWPCESRGLVDSLGSRGGALSRLAGGLADWLADWLAARLGPVGRVTARLEKGQTVALEGARLARVECLSGTAWVTSSSDGRDVRLRGGEKLAFPRAGMVAVTAMDAPARVTIGWR